MIQKIVGAVVVLVLIYVVAQPKLNEWFNLGLPGIPGMQEEKENKAQDVASNEGSKSISKEEARKILAEDSNKHQKASEKETNSGTTKPTTSNVKDSGDDTQLGEMREIGNNVFRSTAGLVYGPGSIDKHRLKHVLAHAKDNKSKPIHGVFDVGGEREVFALLDEAYLLIKKNSPQVKARSNDGRPGRSYDVNMKRRVGYVGGRDGGRSGNPAANYVRMVLENDRVITAFPVRK